MQPSPLPPPLDNGEELKRVLLLVDYSNILYRAYFSSLNGSETRPWLPLLRFLDSLRLCVQRCREGNIPIEVIFAGESRQKLERTKRDKTYKSQRVPVTNDEFRNFRKTLALLLKDLGATILSREGAEADDVIASVVAAVCPLNDSPWSTSSKRTDTTVIVFSNDKDLYQLLKYDRCYIYKNPGVFYTQEVFYDEFGFLPHNYPMYKAMIGDKSDNIHGVNGIGPVSATKHISEGSVPVTNPEFMDALNLVELDYDLDVPAHGEKLIFDFELLYSRKAILKFYGRNRQALNEIILAMRMLDSVYHKQ